MHHPILGHLEVALRSPWGHLDVLSAPTAIGLGWSDPKVLFTDAPSSVVTRNVYISLTINMYKYTKLHPENLCKPLKIYLYIGIYYIYVENHRHTHHYTSIHKIHMDHPDPPHTAHPRYMSSTQLTVPSHHKLLCPVVWNQCHPNQLKSTCFCIFPIVFPIYVPHLPYTF